MIPCTCTLPLHFQFDSTKKSSDIRYEHKQICSAKIILQIAIQMMTQRSNLDESAVFGAQALSCENPFSGSRDIEHCNFNPVIPAYFCVEFGASTIFFEIRVYRVAPLRCAQISVFT